MTEEIKKERTVTNSVRLKESVSDKLDAIFDDLKDKEGATQNSVIAKMIAVYEEYVFRNEHPERSKEMEQMETYLAGIKQLHDTSIKIVESTEERIRGEFAKELESLKTALTAAQEKNATLEQTTSEALKAEEQAKKDAAAEIEKNKTEMEKLQLQHTADTATIEALKARGNEAAAQAEKTIAEIKAEATAQIAEAEKKAERDKTELEKDKAKLEGKIEALQEEIKQLKEEKTN